MRIIFLMDLLWTGWSRIESILQKDRWKRLFEERKVLLVNYSVCKEKGNESEMVHCPSCAMDYFNFSFSAFRSSKLRPCSLAVLSIQRFKESIAKEISSSFLLIKAKSLISSSLILPSRAI